MAGRVIRIGIPRYLIEDCIVCHEKIEENFERIQTGNGSVCMKCEGKEIDVYKVMMPGSKHGYYESDIEKVMDLFRDDLDAEYTIKRETMNVVEYHNLPDFEGF